MTLSKAPLTPEDLTFHLLVFLSSSATVKADQVGASSSCESEKTNKRNQPDLLPKRLFKERHVVGVKTKLYRKLCLKFAGCLFFFFYIMNPEQRP